MSDEKGAALRQQQPTDADMARALEAARWGLAPEHVAVIEEALAAYTPHEARTVKAIDLSRLRELAGRLNDGMLPEELSPVSAEWYELCERAAYVDRIKISGDLAEAIVKAIGAIEPRIARELLAVIGGGWK